MSRSPALAGVIGVVLAATSLAACSSSQEAASAPASAIEAAQSAADAAGTQDMRALCDQMIADGLSPEEATTLAGQAGYVARVGSIDGQEQALTMDYREDRFTFEVVDGAVVGCTYG